MKTILIAILVTISFVLYLLQHRFSVNATQDIAKLEKTKQLLNEEVITLESECAKIFLYANLEQIAQRLNLSFPLKSPKQNQITNLPSLKTDALLIVDNKQMIDD